MARLVNRLNPRLVATLKTPGRHADGAGLVLVVDQSGAKRWVYIFQWEGKRKEMGLGSLAVVGLAEARQLADDARKKVSKGINPIEARRQAAPRLAVTFGDVADELLASLEEGWTNPKHGAQWRRSLKEQTAALRPIPVADVGTDDVLKVLQPIWTATPETASRLRGRIERVLDAAKAMGHRTGENPARWRGHLALLMSKPRKLVRGHHAAMPFAEVPKFLVQLKGRQGVANRALEFTIQTVARSGETLGGQWPEIDREAKLWIVPAERMKARKEHRVPLTDSALAILDAMLPLAERDEEGRPVGYIFPGRKRGRPMSVMSMDMALRRAGRDDVTVHGFRSSFRDWAGDVTPFPREVIEAALAHLVGNAVEQAYRRSDALEKRRKLMETWSAYLGTPAGADVVPFTRPGAG